MAKELTGCGKFLVWVVCPALAGAIGYFLIGPRIGGAGIGAKVPAIRSLGEELRKKVKGESSSKSPSSATNSTPDDEAEPPESSGATEFQRLREEERNRPRSR